MPKQKQQLENYDYQIMNFETEKYQRPQKRNRKMADKNSGKKWN